MEQNILHKIRKELEQNANETNQIGAKRFFKEEIKVYGLNTKHVSQIAKDYFKLLKNSTKSEIFELCEQLWKSGYMEESFIACNWSYSLRKSFEKTDFEVFDRWVKKYISNWAACDTLCNHTIGSFIEMNSEYLSRLSDWASSNNRWVRRASAVSLIIPAKKGLFMDKIFEIADILLTDTDDLVQKGYGWMLKAASQAHQKQVFDYVVKNKAIMPRTALRYAIEKMPKDLKTITMQR
jgi:3-methyladenine DNA glycosylase AlkD